MLRPLGLGVIGLGRAFAAMAPSILAHPSIRLVAAADGRAEALRRCTHEFGATCSTSLGDVLGNPAVEAVYVATPHQFHAAHAIAALRAGKHVLVEKPMALTLGECGRMTRAAARYDRHLIVGHTHGSDPPVAHAARLIASGRYGRLRMINAFDYTDFLYRPRRPEELDTRRGGGAIFNQAPHQVDIVRRLVGRQVETVRAVTGTWDATRPTQGAYGALLTFPDGAVAMLAYSGYARFDSDVFTGWVGETGRSKDQDAFAQARRRLREFSGAKAEADFKAMTGYGGDGRPGATARAFDGRTQFHEHFGMVIASCERADLVPLPTGVTIHDDHGRREIAVPPGRGGGPRAATLDELYYAVRRGRAPLHNGAWGAATIEVCLAILGSSRTGRTIRLRQ